jgi:hypothetical protein
LIFTSICGYAQEYKYKKDPFIKDKINIFDKYGKKTGWYKKDAFNKSKINIYNSSGTIVKTVKANPFYGSEQNKYPKKNHEQKKPEIDLFDAERKKITDNYNNIIGYQKADPFIDNKISVFNKKGVKTGYYKKNVFTGNWEYFSLSHSFSKSSE